MAQDDYSKEPRQGFPQLESMVNAFSSAGKSETGHVHRDKDVFFQQAASVMWSIRIRLRLRQLGFSSRDAEDAIQETICKLLEHASVDSSFINHINQMEAYLLATARRICIDMNRRTGREHKVLKNLEMMSGHDQNEEHRDAEHTMSLIKKAINDLKPIEREIINLRTVGHSYKDISGIVGMREETARKRYQLAINRLQELLRKSAD